MTFDIGWLPRHTPRDQYEQLRKVMRSNGDFHRYVQPTGDRLAERAALAAELSDCTVNGVTGIVESGRDCDCVQYTHSATRTGLTLIAFERERDSIYSWADGPCYVSLCRPDELPGNHSRDLALEAFEDGHAHIVSEVRFDEDGSFTDSGGY